MSWVYETPKSLTYRVNTEITSFEEICETLRKKLEVTQTRIRTFDEIPEMIVIEARSSNDPITLEIHNAQEVIVDCACGAAVLRGAHVFGPGVLCMSHGKIYRQKQISVKNIAYCYIKYIFGTHRRTRG